MRIRRQTVILAVLALLIVPCVGDYIAAQMRLPAVSMDVTLSPDTVMADGKQTGTVTVRVTENGKPRAGDLVQSWLMVGNGLLSPQWTYTDENGVATVKFTPNAMTRYEVQDRAEIHFKDINIGRLVEVGKEQVVVMPLTAPPVEEQQHKTMGFGN